jgi:hypothetical protein
MPPKTKITLSDAQKYELCPYARDNEKTRTEYVNWVENKWGVRINESTITLQKKDVFLHNEITTQYFMQCGN